MMIAQFQQFSTLSCGFSCFFVTLIPKVDCPSQLGDFTPISLVRSLYKILSKVLVSRLSSVMDKPISPNQFVFLKGRLLVDGVVIMNELVVLVKHSRKYCLLFKVDFEKACDFVS